MKSFESVNCFELKESGHGSTDFCRLHSINNRVKASRDDVEQNGTEFPVEGELRETVEDDDDEATDQHHQIQDQMSAAGLQSFTVQRLVSTGQTHHNDLSVGENHAADGGCEQDHGEGQAVDVVDEDALTGQFEERGVVAVRIHDQSPASVQPHCQTQQNPHQHKGHPPGRHCQLDHHSVGHDDAVAQGVTDGHVPVKGHGHEHGVSCCSKCVNGEGLDHTLVITDDTFRRRTQHIYEQTRDQDGVANNVIYRKVTEKKVHGLVKLPVSENEENDAHIHNDYKQVEQEETEEDGVQSVL